MPRDLSIVRPRSFCPACEHAIAWYDNVPVLSYVLLGARCRHCGAGISIRYPAVELLSGALFFAAVWMHGPGLVALKLCAFAALLVGLVFSDLEKRILPDEFTLGGAALGVVLAIVVPMDPGPAYVLAMLLQVSLGPVAASVTNSILGAVVTGGAMWLVGNLYQRIRHREGLGFGDVKMVAMIGTFLGLQATLTTLILGSVAGSVIGLLYILLWRKDASTCQLPFGSFVGAAAICVAFSWKFVFV